MGFHGDRWIPTGYCLYGTTLAVIHKLITCSSAHLCEIFHIREPLLAIHPPGLMETNPQEEETKQTLVFFYLHIFHIHVSKLH